MDDMIVWTGTNAKESVEEISKQWGCVVKYRHDHGRTIWVLQKPREGTVAFAVVRDDGDLIAFEVPRGRRRRGYARALMDILTAQYKKMSTRLALVGGPIEALLLGSGFVHSGNNIMKYQGE